MNDACVSYNLGPTRGMSRTCELSDTDHVGFPDQLVVKEGAEYCPIRNPCTSSPCAAIEICKPDFTWDSFTCIHKMIACRQLTKCPIYQNCVVRAETFAVECLGRSR
ncbi:uncharacterized protein LOC116299853 [Actinia tenebrosa]|uniref:Uncharacterized protein LOC116299853 n=1 Tax=Actinia tenebrosa TaxID=6105 RepID=A0A6P8IDM5_ACTTE|nr:uncharacterized protein LOC116299853 [Actinia tenebrosa]